MDLKICGGDNVWPRSNLAKFGPFRNGGRVSARGEIYGGVIFSFFYSLTRANTKRRGLDERRMAQKMRIHVHMCLLG